MSGVRGGGGDGLRRRFYIASVIQTISDMDREVIRMEHNFWGPFKCDLHGHIDLNWNLLRPGYPQAKVVEINPAWLIWVDRSRGKWVKVLDCCVRDELEFEVCAARTRLFIPK